MCIRDSFQWAGILIVGSAGFSLSMVSLFSPSLSVFVLESELLLVCWSLESGVWGDEGFSTEGAPEIAMGRSSLFGSATAPPLPSVEVVAGSVCSWVWVSEGTTAGAGVTGLATCCPQPIAQQEMQMNNAGKKVVVVFIIVYFSRFCLPTQPTWCLGRTRLIRSQIFVGL